MIGSNNACVNTYSV